MPRTTSLGPADHTCLEDRPTHDPATVLGFLHLLILWVWHAAGCVLRLKIPQWPRFWRQAYFIPLRTGGAEHRYGHHQGGPQIFGGRTHDGYECTWGRSLQERTYAVVRNGRRHLRGWVLRRPEVYSDPPKSRWTTSATLVAYREIAG